MDGEVLLETYPTAQAAELDAAYLQSHGVEARIDGAVSGVSAAGAFSGLALGELVAIRLSVPKSQLEQARELLAELRKPDLRRPTFRVPSDRRLLFAFIVGVGSVILASVVVREWALPAAVCGFIVGWLIGKRSRTYHCAASDCTGRFERDAASCPKCSRRIVGEIAHESDRLEAEEEWERSRRKDAYRREPSSEELND